MKKEIKKGILVQIDKGDNVRYGTVKVITKIGIISVLVGGSIVHVHLDRVKAI